MAGIATTLEALDPDFVGAALGRPGEVRRVRATRIGTGQVAVTARLEIEWHAGADSAAPVAIVAKIPSSEPASRQAARLIRTYETEVGFYCDVSSHVSVPHPKALHAAIDGEGDFTLLLTCLDGVVGDQLVGCSIADARAMVDAAVGLHAPTWGRRSDLLTLSWIADPSTEVVSRRVAFFRTLLPGFEDRFASRLDGTVFAAARWLGDHLETVLGSYRSAHCLTHGDFRLDNMLFDRSADESSVSVVDWQTVALGRGPVDVAYGLGSGLNVVDRRSCETELVSAYRQALSAAGVDASQSDIEWDYRLGTTSGLVMAVIASQLVASTERGDEMFAVMAERHALQMEDHEVWKMVGGTR